MTKGNGVGKPGTYSTQEVVDIADLPEDERREIMAKAREYVHTHNIKRSQEKSTKKRKRKRGALKLKDDARWFELEGYFDPSLIEATPIENSGFMMGVLEDMVVVEVEKEWPHARIMALGAKLEELGIKALIVQRGIKFMRLKAVTNAQEKNLNEIMAQKMGADTDGESGETDSEKPERDGPKH